MSLFSWFSAKPKKAPESSRLPHDELTAPQPKTVPTPARTEPQVNIKQLRHERREQLYGVVRSVMLRSEVLASHYKFKVLSLDAAGRRFLIMMDLLDQQALHPDRWAPVEQLIAKTAAQRHDLQVKAVYWRLVVPMVTTAETAADATPAPVAAHAAPAPAKVSGGPRFEPIDQDEVLAFKKAIAAVTPEDPLAPEPGQVVTSGPRLPSAMTGYEDTLLLESDDAASPLSKTQFGGLD
ncbi:hypothetical protein [Rhodoferax sp.]|uniref:hypothetical protein n=1 Tax=Rhodoferax sp. TaxID=50421 RepID=UPI00260AEF7D|nr:hypothetical protein [Rhodoferax sp.]MDD2925481.1 hypothetical protein [Rhodoferax sp.]